MEMNKLTFGLPGTELLIEKTGAAAEYYRQEDHSNDGTNPHLIHEFIVVTWKWPVAQGTIHCIPCRLILSTILEHTTLWMALQLYRLHESGAHFMDKFGGCIHCTHYAVLMGHCYIWSLADLLLQWT